VRNAPVCQAALRAHDTGDEAAQGALRKGSVSKAALTGAAVLELGSGAGLGGIAAAMLGARVTLTDVADVLPLLRENVAGNFQTAMWAEHVALREQFGSLTVRELDWTKPEQLDGYGTFDCIIATDCVYHETLALDLLRVVLHCTGAKTQGAHLRAAQHATRRSNCTARVRRKNLCRVHDRALTLSVTACHV